MLPGIVWDGKPIGKPGIYAAIPLDKYHGPITVDPSVSHSDLDVIFTQSARHFWDRWYMNKEHEERETTAGMRLGSAAHHLFLGEREFQKYFAMRPKKAPDGRDWHHANKSCIAWEERHADKTVFTPDQSEALKRMNKALREEPIVRAGILNGHIEQSFMWCDEATGLWCKGRPDVVPNHSGDYADLKVVADITDDGIQRAIGNFGYHRQAALVLEGAATLLRQPLVFREGGGEGFSWTLVFVESKRPHCVETITLSIEDLQMGHRDNVLARQYVRHCLDHNDWPGPGAHKEDARVIHLKPWDRTQADDRAAYLKQLMANVQRSAA